MYKLIEWAYTEREVMLYDTDNQVSFLKKLKFIIVNYLANKY